MCAHTFFWRARFLSHRIAIIGQDQKGCAENLLTRDVWGLIIELLPRSRKEEVVKKQRVFD